MLNVSPLALNVDSFQSLPVVVMASKTPKIFVSRQCRVRDGSGSLRDTVVGRVLRVSPALIVWLHFRLSVCFFPGVRVSRGPKDPMQIEARDRDVSDVGLPSSDLSIVRITASYRSTTCDIGVNCLRGPSSYALEPLEASLFSHDLDSCAASDTISALFATFVRDLCVSACCAAM